MERLEEGRVQFDEQATRGPVRSQESGHAAERQYLGSLNVELDDVRDRQ